jgi:hypothetical protein
MLFSGSGGKLCNPLPALFHGVAYRPSTLSLHCFSSVCLLIVCTEISSLPLPLSPDYSLLFVIQFCLGVGVISLLGAVLVCVPGGGYGSSAQCVVLTHLLIDAQAGLELVPGAAVARIGSKFSQCNVS